MHPGGFWVRRASGVPYTLQQPGWQSAEEARGRRHHGPTAPPTLQRTQSRSAIQRRKEPHDALSGARNKKICPVKPQVSYLCVQLTDFCVGETVQAARILFSITVVRSQLEGMNTVNRQGNVYSGTCCSVELTQNSLIQISYKWTDGCVFFHVPVLKTIFFFSGT